VRVVNVVDLCRLMPREEHPHGLDGRRFDELFTTDKPVVFAFHSYPWLIHRLTYRRTNHANIHVRGYKEEGTITTPFDMTVLNELDRFHLAIAAIDRLPVSERKLAVKREFRARLGEHRRWIEAQGEDMPEIRDWRWVGTRAVPG
jgi:xylulose-5-phosphate/fructose-6-phosphate phosphoketolase